MAEVGHSDRVVLLNLARLGDAPLILEGSAALVWGAIEGEVQESDLLDEIARRAAVPPESVRADVLGLLHQLEERGFVGFRTDGREGA